jgi:hypothetical protein
MQQILTSINAGVSLKTEECFAGKEAAKEPQMTITEEKDRDSQTLTSLTCQQ